MNSNISVSLHDELTQILERQFKAHFTLLNLGIVYTLRSSESCWIGMNVNTSVKRSPKYLGSFPLRKMQQRR